MELQNDNRLKQKAASVHLCDKCNQLGCSPWGQESNGISALHKTAKNVWESVHNIDTSAQSKKLRDMWQSLVHSQCKVRIWISGGEVLQHLRCKICLQRRESRVCLGHSISLITLNFIINYFLLPSEYDYWNYFLLPSELHTSSASFSPSSLPPCFSTTLPFIHKIAFCLCYTIHV